MNFRASLIAVGLLAAGVASAAGGFRNDGTGAWSGELPARWRALADASWSVAAPSWSNASPVLFGDVVCALSEPTWLWCVDARTGAARWKVSNGYADTLTGDARTAFEAQLASAKEAAVRVKTLQARLSELRRELRARPGDPALTSELSSTSSTLASERALVEGVAVYDTPPDREIIGYATATPVTDGTRLYAVFGNGVVTAVGKDGARQWSVWLGPSPKPMRGYGFGTAASPVLADGLLVVGHGALVGLDPATGAVRWRGPTYTDYGTPAVAKVGSTTVLLTPAGELVRARDGKVLQTGLGDLWFTGPQVVGTDVYYAGAYSDLQIATGRPVKVTAWRLAETSPGVVTATRRFDVVVPTKSPVFAAPAPLDSTLYVVDRAAGLWSVSAADGAVASVPAISGPSGSIYSAIMRAGRGVMFASETGVLTYVVPGQVPVTGQWEPLRSTPVLVGGRLYVRTLDHLMCFGCSP